MAHYICTNALDFVIEMSKRYAPVTVSAKRVKEKVWGHVDGIRQPTSLSVELQYEVTPDKTPNTSIPRSEEIARFLYRQSRHNGARKDPDFLFAGNSELAEIGPQIAARLFELLELSPEFIRELRYTGGEFKDVVVTREVIDSLSGNTLPDLIEKLEDPRR